MEDLLAANGQLSSALVEVTNLSQIVQGDEMSAHLVYLEASGFNDKASHYATLAFLAKTADCASDRKMIGQFAAIVVESLRGRCSGNTAIQSRLTKLSGLAKHPSMVIQIVKVRDKVASMCEMIQ